MRTDVLLSTLAEFAGVSLDGAGCDNAVMDERSVFLCCVSAGTKYPRDCPSHKGVEICVCIYRSQLDSAHTFWIGRRK